MINSPNKNLYKTCAKTNQEVDFESKLEEAIEEPRINS
jgi:hypothetical protein